MTRSRPRSWLAWLALVPVFALGACSGQEANTAAERGRQVYLANCAACHASDPSQNGPLGPPVKGSSPELLEARILRGAYPPGYTPKRPSAVMQPLLGLVGSISDIAAYLR